MNAEKALNKYGLIKRIDDPDRIEYTDRAETLRIQFNKKDKSVEFLKKYKSVKKTNYSYLGCLTFEEIKAIEKQCDEIESAQTLDKEV